MTSSARSVSTALPTLSRSVKESKNELFQKEQAIPACSFCYGSRDSVELAKRARQKTTRYAGARQMLYKDNHLSDTM